MSDGWWARRLGISTPPGTAPGGPASRSDWQPQKAVRWQQSYPPTGPRQEVTGEDQPEGYGDDTYHRVRAQGFDVKAPGSIGQSSGCPSCHGSNYFRRKGPFGIEAAPLCTECGYNGNLWEQSGTTLNGAGVKSSGPTQFARSDNPHADSHFGMDATLANHNWSPAAIR